MGTFYGSFNAILNIIVKDDLGLRVNIYLATICRDFYEVVI